MNGHGDLNAKIEAEAARRGVTAKEIGDTVILSLKSVIRTPIHRTNADILQHRGKVNQGSRTPSDVRLGTFPAKGNGYSY